MRRLKAVYDSAPMYIIMACLRPGGNELTKMLRVAPPNKLE